MFDVFYLDHATGAFPHERKADSIEHARSLSRTRFFWVLNYLVDYTGFDFLWEPVPWESQQAHVWPSQHQTNSGTWLLPKTPHTDINRNHRPLTVRSGITRLHIKHNPQSPDQGDFNVRFVSDYLGTIRRALKNKFNLKHCWVTSDVCDYSNFDFSWHPSEWQTEMLHVFASDEQKFGDTFYIHLPSFLEKTNKLQVLEWYDSLNFVEDVSVPRLPMPSVEYHSDSMVDAIWDHLFATPLVEFHQGLSMGKHLPTVCLWQEKTRTVVPVSRGHATAVVPRDAKNYLKTQVYDYPNIDKTHIMLCEPPLDIVFISNGEPNAEQNYQHLLEITKANMNSSLNAIRRVSNVNGRVAAYHAAAQASVTPWFFAVFAKLEVDKDFDWQWQPDRFQEAKHYIFHAENPCNGLVYGHQAMIAYNRELVLNNPGVGLDFTLDSAHEVVPVVSGIARYTDTAWSAWRTAFRECIKLQASLPDVDSEYRLKQWRTIGQGTNGDWSRWGAEDAAEYYQAVNGDPVELRKSYEWQWLASYAFMKRGLSPNQ